MFIFDKLGVLPFYLLVPQMWFFEFCGHFLVDFYLMDWLSLSLRIISPLSLDHCFEQLMHFLKHFDDKMLHVVLFS